MVDAVPDHMNQGVLDRLQYPAVDLEILSLNGQFDVLVMVPGEIAHQTREEFQQGRKRQHQGFFRVFQEIVHHAADHALVLFGGFCDGIELMIQALDQNHVLFHQFLQLRLFRQCVMEVGGNAAEI